jgi:hypothetical protein
VAVSALRSALGVLDNAEAVAAALAALGERPVATHPMH